MLKYLWDYWRTYEFWQGRPDYPDWIVIEVQKKSFNPDALVKYTNQPLIPLNLNK